MTNSGPNTWSNPAYLSSNRSSTWICSLMWRSARSAWCREQGLYPAELDAWKQDAIAGLGEPRAARGGEEGRHPGNEGLREMQFGANHDRPLATVRCLRAKRSGTGGDRCVAD